MTGYVKTLVLFLLASTSATAQFTGASGGPFAVGSAPRSVAVGDFNGDGKPDFVTANFNGNSVTVLLGNGSGGFTPATGTPFAVGTNPQSVAVADFNGDGKPDLVTANFGGNNVTVLLGNGSGGFTATPASPIAVGASPAFVATGDFNGDGKLDIVTANSGDNTITVLLGDGTGGFTVAAGSPFAVGVNPQSVAAADFSEDGKLDIITANAGDNTLTELLGNGTGGFTAAAGSPFTVGVNPQSVAVGDFNGDGDLDIVTADVNSNSVTVLLGDGTGGFAAAAGSPFGMGTNPQSVAVGDFNGDGNLDIVAADSGSNAATVLLGDGTGGFTASAGSPLAVGTNPQSLAVADFNGDGKPDIVTANFNGNSATVLLNSLPAITLNLSSLIFYAGTGQASPGNIPVSVSSSAAGYTYTVSSSQSWLVPTPTFNATGGVTTVNLSASAASLTAGVYAGTVRYTAPNFFGAATAVMFSVANPSGGLQAANGSPFPLGTTPASVAVGDFNNDGNPDLVTADTGNNTVTLLLGNGNGGFTAAAGSPFAVGANPQSVAVGDFNGDGNLDLATANFGDNTVTVLLGNGAGGLTPAAGSPFAVGTNPQSLAVADFNGDGKPDVVTANNGANNLTVLLGDGTGGFELAPGSPLPSGLFPQSVAVADFNGDGKPDLVEANSGDDTVRVLLGDGTGRFTASGAFEVGSLPQSVAVADFNGDGKLDIVTANSGSNTVAVLLGNGLGAFTAVADSPFTVGANPQSVAALDINGDGNPDIVTANSGSNTVTVLLGNGLGGFAAAAGSPFAAGITPISVVAGAFNGDGRPGIAAADIAGTMTVLLGMQEPSSSLLSTTAASTIAYGTSVPLKLAVSGGYGGPTGTATFLDAGVAIGTSAQTSSPYSFTATDLAAGAHTLTGSYGGDAAYTSSTSNTVSITVTQASQTITFGTLSTKGLNSAPFTLSATASSGLAVSFTSTTLPVCTVSGATVTLATTGTCTIQASQAGNGNYSAAPPVSQHFTVTPPPNQTITFNTLANQIFGTAPFTVSATASSGLAVSFTSSTPPVCTVSGATVTLVSAGTCTIQASQSGNASFAAATPVNQSFTVTPKSQTITFAAPANKPFGTLPFTVSATASSGLAVSFASTTLPVCTVATATVTLLSAGTCTIAASQAGSTNYAAATTVNQSFTVTPASQAITFGALASQPYGAAPFALTATASSGLAVFFTSTTLPVCTLAGATVTIVSVGTCTIQAAQPGNTNYAAATAVSQHFTVTTASQTITFGALSSVAFAAAPFALTATASSGLTVTFTSTTLTVCTVSAATVTLVGGGSCAIQATQLGNTDYAAATPVSQSFTVTPGSQIITFGPLPNLAFGTPPITVTATASSGLTVSFTSTTASICTVAVATVKLLSAGTCTIQASQAGNTDYAAAPQVSQSFTVTPKAQTITFAALQNQVFGTAPFTVSATASSNLAVSFTSTTMSVCTVSTATVTLLSQGTCTIEAGQPGNTTYAPATSVDQSFTVTQGTQTITFAALSNKALGTAPFNVSATASSSLTVTFASNSDVCTVSGNTVTLAIAGTCTIQASQPGNADYTAATPVDQSFTVTPASQTITFGALATQPLGTAPFALSATASSGLPVSFTSTTLPVCTASNGMVTLLKEGTCTIQASQPGNSNYGPAPPVSQTFTVGAGVLTIKSVLNAGSYAAAPIAADECGVAFGIDLATTTAQTASLSLSKTLAGATVTIADSTGVTQAAPLFYVSPGQINFLVPSGLAMGNGTVTVTNAAGNKVSFPTTIAPVSPSLFTADSSGTGAPAAIALTYVPGQVAQATPVFNCSGSPAVCTATPISLGSSSTSVYLELFGTGIRGRATLSAVAVTVGGLTQQVTYAGAQATYAGLDQVNVLLSPSLAGSGQVTLQLTVDGIQANPVTVDIQ